MKVLVTGAAGLTGAEVARALLTRGHSVVGVIHREEQRSRVPVGTEIAIADCRDATRMDALIATVDALVHVAGILLGRDIARIGRLRAPSSVVVVSTASIYSAHRASAGLYRANEEALRAARPDLVLVRPTMIYGSVRDRNVHHVIRFAHRYGLLPLFGSGDQRIQPIHYKDVAGALAALVGARAPAPLDAGGGEALTLRASAEAIFAALGLAPRFVPVPRGPTLAAARVLDLLRGSRWAERIERMSEDRSVDNGPLITLTGLSPRDFPTGVRQEVAAMFAFLR